MKTNNFKKIVLMCLLLYFLAVVVLLSVIFLPAKAEVYQFSSIARAYWAGTKPVQLVIDTEFSDSVVSRTLEILAPYPFVLKERKNIDAAYNPQDNEVAVAFASIHHNTGASFVRTSFRQADGGINRGLCMAGTASTDERLAWIIVHEIFHSIGIDHSQPYRWFEGDKNTRGLMFSNRPKLALTHDDLRALSETFRQDLTNCPTITVTGTVPKVFHGVMLNLINIDNFSDSSQVLLNYTFSNEITFELKNVKKGRYYITLSPVIESAGILNQDLKSDIKGVKYHRSKRTLILTKDTEIEIKI